MASRDPSSAKATSARCIVGIGTMRVSSWMSSEPIRMLRSHASAVVADFSAVSVRWRALRSAALICPVAKLRRFTAFMLARRAVAGHVQKVRVARLGSREVALLEVRVPGETRHVVVAEGLGVGLLDAEGRARVRAAMAGAAKPGAALALGLAEQATAAMAGVGVGPGGPEREALEARGRAIVAEVAAGAVAGRGRSCGGRSSGRSPASRVASRR